ncbi:MAG: signal peptidase II [Acutalibacteraceae bacterium]|nr:signal peptidase II [Acutalibacteraceae bacterium]
MLSCVLAIVVGAVLLVIDQITKYIVVQNLPLGASVPFIPNVLGFWHIHNKGGAWGFLEGYTWILLSVTLIVMIICVAMILKHGVKNKLLFWAVTLVLSGGIGNLIDRVFNSGEVVDFLHLEFMDFPVFNIADCSIVIGAGLLVVYFIVDMINERRINNANARN